VLLDAGRAQQVLADYLVVTSAVDGERVEKAFRSVARHEFFPDTPLELAYADLAVQVAFAASGAPISSASQPSIAAEMLEMLDVRPGNSVHEIGTATGYNAALLDFLVSPDGSVTTIELDDDLGGRAAQRLARLGFVYTQVVIGDGKAGFPENAPYDRIIVTAGARSTQSSWNEQLLEGGRLVVPVVDAHGVGEVTAFAMVNGLLEVRGTHRCGFLPLR
jgi:protein-L-isoaspartate(D-aspartate) O-methyltransferase